MANAFSKTDVVYFEDVVAGFNNNNIAAKQASVYSPNMQEMEQSSLTVHRPVPMISQTTSGRDISSDYKDVTGLTVPTSLSESDIHNIAFKMNSVELNDPIRRKMKVDSAIRQLSSKVDTVVANRVANYGSQVVTSATALDSYLELAGGETVMLEQGVSAEMARTLLVNPRDSANIASDLANREYLGQASMNAYERSKLRDIAGFDTFRATVLPTISGSAASGVTVNGANQNHTPLSTDANGNNVDNRTQTLTVSASHGLVAGDCFTLAGVYAVNMETKQSTGNLLTFRVVSVATNDLTITPAIVPADGAAQAQIEYANVTTTPADGAALTVLNIANKMASLFYCNEAVEIIHGRLAVDDLGGTMSIMRETTDSGIEIIFAKQGNIDDLVAKYRLTIWVNANVLQPQMAGIMLGNQT